MEAPQEHTFIIKVGPDADPAVLAALHQLVACLTEAATTDNGTTVRATDYDETDFVTYDDIVKFIANRGELVGQKSDALWSLLLNGHHKAPRLKGLLLIVCTACGLTRDHQAKHGYFKVDGDWIHVLDKCPCNPLSASAGAQTINRHWREGWKISRGSLASLDPEIVKSLYCSTRERLLDLIEYARTEA